MAKIERDISILIGSLKNDNGTRDLYAASSVSIPHR